MFFARIAAYAVSQFLRGDREEGEGLGHFAHMMTVFVFEIFFGILHLIGVSIIFAYPFLRWPIAALPVGAGLIVLGIIIGTPRVDFPWLVWLGFRPMDIGTMYDYRPMIPWFGVALLGISAGYLLYRNGARRFQLPDLSGVPVIRGLSKAGQYSLAIYLIHQPVFLLVLELTGVIDLGLF
jgi:uncharacterized membrane protein